MARIKVILHRRVVPRNRTWLKVLITVGVLLVLVIGGMLLYTYFGPSAPPPKKAESYSELPKKAPAREQNHDNPASVAITSLSDQLHPGENAQLLVKTNQRADCKVTVEYNKPDETVHKIPETDSGLVPKQADEYGAVSWTWTVSKVAPQGYWPVRIYCTYYGKTATGGKDIQILKPGDVPQVR